MPAVRSQRPSSPVSGYRVRLHLFAAASKGRPFGETCLNLRNRSLMFTIGQAALLRPTMQELGLRHGQVVRYHCRRGAAV